MGFLSPVSKAVYWICCLLSSGSKQIHSSQELFCSLTFGTLSSCPLLNWPNKALSIVLRYSIFIESSSFLISSISRMVFAPDALPYFCMFLCSTFLMFLWARCRGLMRYGTASTYANWVRSTWDKNRVGNWTTIAYENPFPLSASMSPEILYGLHKSSS